MQEPVYQSGIASSSSPGEAKRCFEISHNCTSGSSAFDPVDGGTLPLDQHHTLAAIALCTLAIEARANHLIDELAEKGLSEDTARAAKWLPTKEKWFLLPTLAVKGTKVSAAVPPHQAIAQLCDLRNNIMHVKFADIARKRPAVGTVESYFKGFVAAMEDMNVVLGRDVTAPRPEVLAKGRFTCSYSLCCSFS
jgi:hypothetical protein